MDNLFVGNNASTTGVSDAVRETLATHWLAAGANLITGLDLTAVDDVGKRLLTLSGAWVDVAAFAAQYPMQPRNPGSGGNDAKQLQAWIAGPSDVGEAVVLLVNYGPDEGHGGFGTSLAGSQNVTASWEGLGISGQYQVRNVWAEKDIGVVEGGISAVLNTGESQLIRLRPVAR